jgi:arylsulfatase
MKDGIAHHEYNHFGIERTNIAATKALTAGHHVIKYQFTMDEAKAGAGVGGTALLFVDGEKVAEGKIPKTQPYGFSADEGVNVGADHETPVSEDYKEGDNKFTGKIQKVTVENLPGKK